MATTQYSTFYLDGMFFGIPVEVVQEVLRKQTLTPVPHAPHAVVGLINLRGMIVTSVDLRRVMSLGERKTHEKSKKILLKDGEELLCIIVDKIEDVIDISRGEFEPPPENLQSQIRKMISGVYKLPDRLLLILNIEEVNSFIDTSATMNPSRFNRNYSLLNIA